MGSIFYTLRKRRSGAIAIAKFDEDYKEPLEVYTIVNFSCDCFGSRRTPYCKHRQIQDEFHKLQETQGIGPAGVLYDFDAKLFYCPDDGEGIPLQGAFDLREAVSHETCF